MTKKKNTKTTKKKRKNLKTAIIRSSRLHTTTLALIAVYTFLLLTTVPLRAREKPKDYAFIFGTVWGPDDLPVYGIQINLRRSDQKKAQWHAITNRHGEFTLRVPVGKADYVLWAETKGVKSRSGKHLGPSPQTAVHIESNERADTGLHLK